MVIKSVLVNNHQFADFRDFSVSLISRDGTHQPHFNQKGGHSAALLNIRVENSVVCNAYHQKQAVACKRMVSEISRKLVFL